MRRRDADGRNRTRFPTTLALGLLALAFLSSSAAAQRFATMTTRVAVREEPAFGARAVTHLYLGARVSPDDSSEHVDRKYRRSGRWYRVHRLHGSGWVWGGYLVRDADALKIARAARGVRELASRKHFIDLATFTRTWWKPEGAYRSEERAELAFIFLESLWQVSERVYGYLGSIPVVRAWLKLHDEFISLGEAEPRWAFDPDHLWDLHERVGDVPVADEIAWRAVTVRPPGHCEGFVSCYMDRARVGALGYLKHHPRGAYVNEALERVKEWIGGRLYSPEWDAEDYCEVAAETRAGYIREFREVLSKTRSNARTDSIADLLDRLDRMCEG